MHQDRFTLGVQSQMTEVLDNRMSQIAEFKETDTSKFLIILYVQEVVNKDNTVNTVLSLVVTPFYIVSYYI